MSTLAATNLKHASSASNNIVLDSSGNVGIGTSSPRTRLDIAGGVISGVGNIHGNSNSTAYSIWGGESTLNGGYIQFWGSTSAAPNILVFGNSNSGENMRITSSGNVGIGTSSPGYTLDVRAATGSISSTSTTGTNYAKLQCNNTGGSYQFGIDNSGGTNFGSGVAYARVIWNDSTSAPTIFYTNSTERARIDSSGRVSIGSTTVNALLTVDGVGPTVNNQAFAYFAESGGAAITGYATGQNVTNSIWASSRVSGQEFDARSDARLKKDITPIPASDALHFVQNVMPVHYKWISGPDDGHKFGFIAQDVVKAGFPNLVGQYADNNVPEVTDADGFTSPAGVTLTLNYDQIVPVLASALRDAMSQINDLKARLTALEAK